MNDAVAVHIKVQLTLAADGWDKQLCSCDTMLMKRVAECDCTGPTAEFMIYVFKV